ncbi:hypothetical protein ACH5RR_008663 [Cinchona calisaya]|uniref:Uncharacterized protein n=1 Tax=Cinchona calisaya TaxID=153742 RepID=A0ABD3AC42_9GENT
MIWSSSKHGYHKCGSPERSLHKSSTQGSYSSNLEWKIANRSEHQCTPQPNLTKMKKLIVLMKNTIEFSLDISILPNLVLVIQSFNVHPKFSKWVKVKKS